MSKKVLAKNLDKELRKIKRQLKQRTPELRTQCASLAPTTVLTTGLLYEVTNLGPGFREGEKVRLKNVRIKYHAYCQPNTSISSYTLRVMLVRSKIGPLTSSANYPSIHGCPDTDKYAVLADKMYEFNAHCHDGTSFAGFNGATVNISKSYKNGVQVQYDGGADSQQNGVYLWLISDNTNVVVEGYRLMKYYDV